MDIGLLGLLYKIPQPGRLHGLNHRNAFRPRSGGWESMIGRLADSVSSATSLFGLPPSPCVLTWSFPVPTHHAVCCASKFPLLRRAPVGLVQGPKVLTLSPLLRLYLQMQLLVVGVTASTHEWWWWGGQKMGAQFSLYHTDNINRAFKQRSIQLLMEKSPVWGGRDTASQRGPGVISHAPKLGLWS